MKERKDWKGRDQITPIKGDGWHGETRIMSGSRRFVLLALSLRAVIEACSSLGSSGGCGYGCRWRAHSAGRLDVDGSVPKNYVYGLGLWTDKEPLKNATLEQLTNPNHHFLSCCMERGLPSACSRNCHFATYDESFVTAVTTGVHGCPISALPTMQFCAAQGRDHRECCQRNGVTTTIAGDRCLVFCDQTPDKVVPIDYTYLPCFERFRSMKQCFYSKVQSDALVHFAKRI